VPAAPRLVADDADDEAAETEEDEEDNGMFHGAKDGGGGGTPVSTAAANCGWHQGVGGRPAPLTVLLTGAGGGTGLNAVSDC
jgi:hypothetical protein